MYSRVLQIGTIIIISIVFGLAASYAFAKWTSEPIATYEKGHIIINRDILEGYYNEFGGLALVAEASEEGNDLTRANFHSTGHSVGEVLYNNEGLGSIATCGDSFEYGCLHQVIGRAHAEMGDSLVPSLLTRCREYGSATERAQCEHGLGHGIMFAGNYDDANLEKMMQECDAITTKRPIPKNDSCHAGLMMEYNMHYMTMEYEGQNGRPASTKEPFAVCDNFSTKDHREICIWWALPWLHGKLFSYWHNPPVFKALGTLCETLGDASLKRTCFQSIGRSNGVNANRPASFTFERCHVATENHDLQSACLEQTIRSYISAGDRDEARALCSISREEYDFPCDSGEN